MITCFESKLESTLVFYTEDNKTCQKVINIKYEEFKVLFNILRELKTEDLLWLDEIIIKTPSLQRERHSNRNSLST